MDDIALLRAHRPDVDEPSAAERAAVLAKLDDPLGQQPAAAPTSSDAPVVVAIERRRGRRRRLVAMGAVAATIVAVVAVAGLNTRGPDQLAAPLAAADQLRAIADAAQQSSPFPPAPYAVTSRSALPAGLGTTDTTVYELRNGDSLIQQGACPASFPLCGGDGSGSTDQPLGVSLDGSTEQVRAAVEVYLASITAPGPAPSRAFQLVMLIEQAFPRATTSSTARGELLRLLADAGDVRVEHNVRSALGDVGDRFTIEDQLLRDHLELVVDPLDGYLLETSGGPVPTDPNASRLERVDSWGRPVADPVLPGAGDQLASELGNRRSAIEAGAPTSRCVVTIHPLGRDPFTYGIPRDPTVPIPFGPIDPSSPQMGMVPVPLLPGTFGVVVPEGWSFSHCW